jgi:hypothetical protein
MASDLETAIRAAKRFEAALARRYGADGRGLHEKIDSVERDLAPETVRALRLVATVRNKIVHEEGYGRIDDRRRFRDACRTAERALVGRRRARTILLVSGLVVIMVIATLALLRGGPMFRIP